MRSFLSAVRRFRRDESGAATLENAMILAIVAIAAVAYYAIGKAVFRWLQIAIAQMLAS